MINLLPNESRSNLVYAKRNSLLLKWTIALATGLAGMVLVIAFGQFYTQQQINTYKKNIASTQEELKQQNLDQIQTKVAQMSGDIKLAVQVLSKQVLFSELIRQIGAAMPSGAALSSLDISKLQGGIDLSAIAKDYKTASQIQVNLQDPNNKIFKAADIQTISCTKGNGADKHYPCQVSIRALFGPTNPFLFIQPGATK